MAPKADAMQQLMDNIMDTIDRVGWNVICVGGDDDNLPFAYTAGLSLKYNHPEIVLTGPWPPQLAQTLLNTVGERVKKGERFNSGFFGGIITMCAIPFRPVTPEFVAANFGVANRICREAGKTVQALQMFLPDKNGRYVDDPEADMSFHSKQPKWTDDEVRRILRH